jgi:opacity protein-like surface antigen
MVSVKVLALAGAAALITTTARAADFPMMPPPPPVLEFAAGWYLRGDIGMSAQNFKGLHQRLYDTPGVTVEAVGMGWDAAPLFGLGIGYQFNHWLRVDLTGEYRGKSNFHGSDNVRFPDGFGGTGMGVDNYSGSKSEWVFMANVYADLGTWKSFTPFIGLGLGMAHIKIHGFRDDGFTNIAGVVSPSVAYADDGSKWNFAWAVHAGVAYAVTQSFTVELAYRYISMGSGTTGPTRAFDGSFTNGGAFTFNNIYSHDFKLGVRWMLDTPAYQPPPLMRRG